MAKAVTSPTPDPWPPEGPPIDAACKLLDGPLWNNYVSAQAVAVAGDLDKLKRMIVSLRPDEERRLAHRDKMRDALDTRVRACLEGGEFELWARPGSLMSEPEYVPMAAISGLKVNYERRTAIGEGLPQLYDVRVRRPRPEIASASVTWGVTTARGLKAAGKIREGMQKAEVARLLQDEMKKAAKAGQVRKALKASYLENQLEAWGLWPISSIK